MSDDLLDLRDGDSVVAIVPRRGAIVSRFDVGARRVLFMDESTLVDPNKNVRGGVPVLFPTPGKLAGDAWSYAGKRGALKQHGFARNQPFAIASATTLRLDWHADAATWPWECTLELAFALRARTLRIDQRVTNRANEPMPFGLGFHPYFQIASADKARARVDTAATRAFDNVTKRVIELRGPIDLTASEVDLHLLDHGRTECTLHAPDGDVHLRGSREFTHWVVWTLAGKGFVCVEPWTCPGDALNSGDRLLVVEPGATREAWIEIEAG
jgi:galactose mutarotase-like enzyme